MSDKVSLTQRQIQFIVYMTEIKEPEAAVEAFMGLMISENKDPATISEVVDKVMTAYKRKYG